MARRFHNLDPSHRPHDMAAILRWGVWDRLRGVRRIAAPGPGAPRVEPDLRALHLPEGAPRATWIGHASFLLSLGGSASLIDPVLSPRVGCVVRRHVPPGLTAPQLPHLSALLITHSHYDHLDARTIERFARDLPVVVPAGLGRWFGRRRFRDVCELAWWETARIGPLAITLVPARHWSRRRFRDVNQTLWGGYVIEAGGVRVYHAGDSGWFDGFARIGERFPGLLAAMLPIGSYTPAWFMEPHHLNPEQAVDAFLDLGARHMVAMHWGTFQLTDEPLREPAERVRRRFAEAVEDTGKRLHVPAVGETIVFD